MLRSSIVRIGRRFREPLATGTSLVRTMVVACATLAILLVCFSIYQYSQRDMGDTASATRKRLPNVETSLQEALGEQESAAKSGVQIGPANVGGGEKAKLTLYRPGQDTAWGEIEVEDYSRIAESTNEFLMIAPEFRMRTTDGHAVRVTAEKCIVEGELGAGLKISRGQLIGRVLIEYDRLTKLEREELLAAGAKEINSMHLVRIKSPQIWFDVEYSKLTMPDELHVIASDILFDAQDVEVRFDEQKGQVDYLRVTGGGSLELLSPTGNMEDGGAFGGRSGEMRLSLGVWLRDTFTKLVLAQQPIDEHSGAMETKEVKQPVLADDTVSPGNAQPPKPALEYDADGIPIFGFDQDGRSRDKTVVPNVRYVAHFEGEVDTQQRVGDVIESRLRSEVLDIVRSFGDEDRKRLGGDADANGTDSSAQATSKSVQSNKRIRLTWVRRLSVQACTDVDPRCNDKRETVIVATGNPVRMDGPQGNGVCNEVQFDPVASSVVMIGSAASPVNMESFSEGLITGRKISTNRRDDVLDIVVEGPGSLRRITPDTQSSTDGSGQDSPPSKTSISFRDSLEVSARYSTITKLDGLQVVTQQKLYIEHAVFTGEVVLIDNDLHLNSNRMTVDFAPIERQSENGSVIEQVQCRGQVRMMRKQDRIRSEELDVLFTQSRNGQMLPLRATARTNVEVVQGRRVMRADQELVVDFENVESPAPPFDASKAYASAKKAGIDPKTVDWPAQRRAHESKTRTDIGVKAMSARGDVVIDDPVQRLEVSAASFECTLVDGKTIESANVIGKPGVPATVRLEDMQIAGPQITLNVREEWATVPGAGRLSLMTQKGLDGKRYKKPKPMVITWTDQMRYLGGENRAVFKGGVHGASATETTFDGEEMLVEFDDVSKPLPSEPVIAVDWWMLDKVLPLVSSLDDILPTAKILEGMQPISSKLQDFLPRVINLKKIIPLYTNTRMFLPLATNVKNFLPLITNRNRKNDPALARISKEPAYILVTGGAKVQVASRDDASGNLLTRSVLAGPQLSVNLRPDVSKMLIEGAGYLQLEDHQAASSASDSKKKPDVGLLGVGGSSGPSLTLIEWGEFMSYDFSIDQTRFEGQVSLKHFAGSEMVKRFGAAFPKASQDQAGRATFLNCDTLTADFRANPGKRRFSGDQRFGGLSAGKLRQFSAAGNVTLQDQVEGIALSATDLTFERERKVLVIQGTELNPAHIVLQRPGRFPLELSTKRAFYNLADKTIESEGTSVRGQ